MAKIHTVVEGYTGIRAGVPFVNGAGETDNPHLISWFRAHGYKVEETGQEIAPAQKSGRSGKGKRK